MAEPLVLLRANDILSVGDRRRSPDGKIIVTTGNGKSLTLDDDEG